MHFTEYIVSGSARFGPEKFWPQNAEIILAAIGRPEEFNQIPEMKKEYFKKDPLFHFVLPSVFRQSECGIPEQINLIQHRLTMGKFSRS
jgi:hypothetical protein